MKMAASEQTDALMLLITPSSLLLQSCELSVSKQEGRRRRRTEADDQITQSLNRRCKHVCFPGLEL